MMRIYLVAALLIGVNWLTYVWAINAGFIIETSLGYFINPLLSVLLGVIFLPGKLRPMQWIPILLAAAGVLYLTLSYGSLPWIALTLAVTWGFYGLVKKAAPLGSLYGVALETGILFLPALGFLIFADVSGSGIFLHTGFRIDLLLAGCRCSHDHPAADVRFSCTAHLPVDDRDLAIYLPDHAIPDRVPGLP